MRLRCAELYSVAFDLAPVPKHDVRSYPKSRHVQCTSPCPLCANSGHSVCFGLSRRAGLSYAQIGDIVGMSAKMVEQYCKNADMRSNSRAALAHLERAMGALAETTRQLKP